MATKFKIKTTCTACNGTGQQPIHPSGSIPCVMCEESGELEFGWFKLKEIEDKLDAILEALNG